MSFLLNPFVFAAAAGDFESIATVTVGAGGASSIEFTSIPGTYQHLQVRCAIAYSVRDATVRLQFNGDTASNYRFHRLSGNGSSAAASAAGSALTDLRLIYDANATANTSVAKCCIFDFIDYADSTKNLTTRAFGGVDVNGAGNVEVSSGLWLDTDAVTSISLKQFGSVGGSYAFHNFAEHSTFALYGIKA